MNEERFTDISHMCSCSSRCFFYVRSVFTTRIKMSVRVEIETKHTTINGTQHTHTRRERAKYRNGMKEKKMPEKLYTSNKINFIASFWIFG